MSNCNLFLKFTTTDPKQSSHLSGYTLSTCVHEIDVCNLMLRGAIASCISTCCITLPIVYAHAPDDDAP